MLRNLPCKRIQADEAWSFCYSKQKNVPADKLGNFGYGDVWIWAAMCADTKLTPSWLIGRRDAGCAHALLQDLAGRLANHVGGVRVSHDPLRLRPEADGRAVARLPRVQLTTDGHRVAVGPDRRLSVRGAGTTGPILVTRAWRNLGRPPQTSRRQTMGKSSWSIESPGRSFPSSSGKGGEVVPGRLA